MNFDSYFILYIKINFMWLTDLNVKSKIVTLLEVLTLPEDNIEELTS